MVVVGLEPLEDDVEEGPSVIVEEDEEEVLEDDEPWSPPLLLSSLDAEALAVAVGRRVRVLVRVWEILDVDAEAVIIVELPLGS